MKLKLIVRFAISFLLLLVSCNSQSLPLQMPTLAIKTTLNSSISAATKISPVMPSPTLSPDQGTETAIHARVLEAEQTQQAFMSSAPATLEARNVKCKEGFVLEQGLDVIRASNNKWTLFTCSPKPKNKNNQWTPGADDYGTRYTQIISADFSKTWTIQHSTFDYSIIDRPDALMATYRWTGDGKYLYLYPRYYPSGSGGTNSGLLETHINNLYRINLETGKFELVLQSGQYGSLLLSPNDQFLVYSENKNSDVIHVRNMENGNDLQVKLNEDISVSGGFVWNSESTMVVITIGYSKAVENSTDDLSGTAIFILTLQNMHAQKVLAKDFSNIYPICML